MVVAIGHSSEQDGGRFRASGSQQYFRTLYQNVVGNRGMVVQAEMLQGFLQAGAGFGQGRVFVSRISAFAPR